MSPFVHAALTGLVVLLVTACSHGPEELSLSLGNAVARPDSHEMAISLNYKELRRPTGFINTFPNGGTPTLLRHEARVYRVDLARQTVRRIAAIPDFGGIPMPISVHLHGWQGDAIYFSLFGYGGDDWSGADLADERRQLYRSPSGDRLESVDGLPSLLQAASNSGPPGPPPFLRFSVGHLEVEIAIDETVSDASRTARLRFDEISGEALLEMPEPDSPGDERPKHPGRS